MIVTVLAVLHAKRNFIFYICLSEDGRQSGDSKVLSEYVRNSGVFNFIYLYTFPKKISALTVNGLPSKTLNK